MAVTIADRRSWPSGGRYGVRLLHGITIVSSPYNSCNNDCSNFIEELNNVDNSSGFLLDEYSNTIKMADSCWKIMLKLMNR